ncbi:MAG: 23S rRNA (guanosine(2251)-2'-O)-methyltransferase RlmB [Thiohalorhabdaceae bacterium]
MTDDGDYLYGIHSVAAALAEGTELAEVRIAKGFHGKRLANLEADAKAAGVRVRRVPREDLDRRSGGARHQGVLARVAAVALWDEDRLHDRLDELAETPFLLLLDGNLGACLRSADAAGVHAVVVPRDRCAPLNPAARKVASGAAETVPVAAVANLARAMDALKERGIFLLGTSDAGEVPWYRADATGPTGWVLGAEGEGMRALTAKKCDALVRIPMAGTVSSLNVAVATGVVLFEAVRQRYGR